MYSAMAFAFTGLKSFSLGCSPKGSKLSVQSNPFVVSTSSSPKTSYMKLKHLPRASSEGYRYARSVRDDSCEWITGYYGRLNDCSSLEAGLWGILNGLKEAAGEGLHDFIIETDCQVPVSLLKNGDTSHSHLRALIEDCRKLIEDTRSTIAHICREGNKVADGLANLGADQDDPLILMYNPPTSIAPLLGADVAGIAFERP